MKNKLTIINHINLHTMPHILSFATVTKQIYISVLKKAALFLVLVKNTHKVLIKLYNKNSASTLYM